MNEIWSTVLSNACLPLGVIVAVIFVVIASRIDWESIFRD